eukprot:GHVN01083013.1.p1 GENE.GHVN01083013.1~~GHVN01083013.1.p1  ORF type:complete len:164 (+),score=38.41 GHVN01083013.1:378-869(+)
MLSPYRPSDRLSASSSPSVAWADFETPPPSPNPTPSPQHPHTGSNRDGGAGRSSWWRLGSKSSKTKSNSKRLMGHGGQSAPSSSQSVMNTYTAGTPGTKQRASEVRGGLSGAHSAASEARSKLMQNKDQLEAVVMKTDEMNNAAANFASYTAHLNQKYSGGRK